MIMKYEIETREIYPVYSPAKKIGPAWPNGNDAIIELTAAEHNDYLRVQKEWDAWQRRFKTEADKI